MSSSSAARSATRPGASSANVEDIKAAMRTSFAARHSFAAPYRYFLVDDLFPAAVADELADLPFAAPGIDGVSGKR